MVSENTSVGGGDAASAARVLPRIVGRSSSHFTRVVRMFAEEASVPYELQIVPSLVSPDAGSYGGNPGLRLPNMITDRGVVFGSLGSCRALESLAAEPPRMVWPEDTSAGLAANALELTLQAMATEVTLIMLTATDSKPSAYAEKLRSALNGMVAWLDANVADALAALPDRQLSYLELTLFCLTEHLEFRKVMPLDGYDSLIRFRRGYGERPSAMATSYRFDV
jgi:glutathione S-transferase